MIVEVPVCDLFGLDVTQEEEINAKPLEHITTKTYNSTFRVAYASGQKKVLY